MKRYFVPYVVMITGAVGVILPGWYLLEYQTGRGFLSDFFFFLSLAFLIPSLVFFWVGYHKLPSGWRVSFPQARTVRDIPVRVGDEFEYRATQSARSAVQVVDEVVFPYYDGQARRRVISEHDMLRFLKVCWSRQAREEPTFERRVWVPRKLDRDAYEAIMHYLVTAGLVSGRRRGNSGVLVLRPERAIRVLRHLANGH